MSGHKSAPGAGPGERRANTLRTRPAHLMSFAHRSDMRRSVEANGSGMDARRAIDPIDDVEEDEIDDQGVTYNWYLMATCRRKKQSELESGCSIFTPSPAFGEANDSNAFIAFCLPRLQIQYRDIDGNAIYFSKVLSFPLRAGECSRYPELSAEGSRFQDWFLHFDRHLR